MKNYNISKQQRKAWWNSLSKTEQEDYVKKKMKQNKSLLNVINLTHEEWLTINKTMQRIGMKDYIVYKG